MKQLNPKKRKCIACQDAVITAAIGDPRRYNCKTGQIANINALSAKCWQNRFPTYGGELLSAILAVRTSDAKGNRSLKRRVVLAENIAPLAEDGRLNFEAIQNLVGLFSPTIIGVFARNLPKDGKLAKIFTAYRYENVRLQRLKYKPIPTPRIRPVFNIQSDEFNRAIELWAGYVEKRAAQKEKFGHNSDPKTPARQIRDTKHFCSFLESIGITRWTDVAQRHLNLYFGETSRQRVQKIYPFLFFVKKNFQFPSTIVPFENDKNKVITRIISASKFNNILNLCQTNKDSESALLILLVGLYAQTVKTIGELRLSHIRKSATGMEITFRNEIWIPLDPETSDVLDRYFHHRTSNIQRGRYLDSDRLFQACYGILNERAIRIARVSMKCLRLTAIMNILKNGFTDRHGIELSLGVSMQTVANVERACGYDIQDYVSEEVAELRRKLLNGELSER